MSRPSLKQQIAVPALAAAVCGAALYVISRLGGGEAFTLDFMTAPRGGYEWAMRLVSILPASHFSLRCER